MSSKSYWAKREEEALKHYITEEAEYDKYINKIYTNMLANCQKEINAFYGRYADKEGITISEAKKRVSSMDIKAYEAKAKRYVKDKTFSKEANEEMRLYNATMRINRLEMLKANIGLELIAGADDLEKFMEGVLKGRTEAELARQAGILGKTIKNNAEAVHSIVNASFHNATFSDRIWNNSAAMKADLDKLIQSGLIAGKNANVLAKDLQKYFIGEPRLKNGKKGAKYRAEVLMRTELARVQTESQKQSFIRNGFTQYQFIVNGNCCDICAGIAGKVFDVEKMMPGENAPPLHPLCRCSTAAYSDRKEYDAWLDYLEKGGTTADWNAHGKTEWEKAQELKNNADYQAKVKARREAFKQRKQNITSSVDFDGMDRKELEQYAQKNFKTKFVDTKGANIDYVREAVKVVDKFEKKMGGKTIDGLKIKFGGTPQGTVAKYDDKTKTVILKKTGSIKAFEESQQNVNARYRAKWGKDKRYYATENYSGTIWHEIGHAVDIDTGQELSRTLSQTSDLDTKSVKISAYAGTTQNVRTTRRSEAWAENFAAYMDGGSNAKEVPKEIIEMIEDYFKKKRG